MNDPQRYLDPLTLAKVGSLELQAVAEGTIQLRLQSVVDRSTERQEADDERLIEAGICVRRNQEPAIVELRV